MNICNSLKLLLKSQLLFTTTASGSLQMAGIVRSTFLNRFPNQAATIQSFHRSRSFSSLLSLRGGGAASSDGETTTSHQVRSSSSDAGSTTKYVTLAQPAPGSPFHLALPVHNLEVAKDFYGNILGCAEGRSSEKWQDYSLNGHQIVCHWAGDDYRCIDYFNPVDGDDIPVPHFGLALTEEQFHDLAGRVRDAGIPFIVEPHLRFKGQPGEQWTMFFKDPSGNNLEFKAMTTIENLFAKYNVKE